MRKPYASVDHLSSQSFAQLSQQLVTAHVLSSSTTYCSIANYVDAYPVKLFEYFAAGLPVVATDVPRWRAVLEAHDCGVCVPFGRPELLGAAIARMLDDDEAARAMGERARRAAEERYSWETQAAALVALYDELLA